MHNSQSVSLSYHSRTAGKIQSNRKRSWVRTGFCYYISVYKYVSAVCGYVARYVHLRRPEDGTQRPLLLLSSLPWDRGSQGTWNWTGGSSPCDPPVSALPQCRGYRCRYHIWAHVGPGDSSLDLSDWAISPGPYCVYFCEPGKYYIISFAQILLNFFLWKAHDI